MFRGGRSLLFFYLFTLLYRLLLAFLFSDRAGGRGLYLQAHFPNHLKSTPSIYRSPRAPFGSASPETASVNVFTSATLCALLRSGVAAALPGAGAVAMVYVSALCFCLEHSRDRATFVLRPGRLGL